MESVGDQPLLDSKPRTMAETGSPDDFAGYAGAVNPTYIRASRSAHRDRFITRVPAKSHGSIFNKFKVL